MKLVPTHKQPPAFSLMETLAYMAVFFVILGLALAAYFHTDEQSRAFTRNTADIVRAMQSGERWRADVRLATNVVADETALRLQTPRGEIAYVFKDQAVWREQSGHRAVAPFLADVKSSRMEASRREHVSAWIWELELRGRRTNATVRPLFTFLAVPQAEVRP